MWVGSLRCECWSLTAIKPQLLLTWIDLFRTPSGWQQTLFLKSYFNTEFVCRRLPWINHSAGRWPTFQHILLHLYLIELVGANNDAVASEVDTAAGLWCLNLLQIQTNIQHLWNSLLPQTKHLLCCKTLLFVHGSIIYLSIFKAHLLLGRTCTKLVLVCDCQYRNIDKLLDMLTKLPTSHDYICSLINLMKMQLNAIYVKRYHQ